SHKKFFPFQNQLANFNHSLIPNVTVLGCFDFRLCCSLELILIANCFAVLNESFKVISLFSYQSSLFVAVQQLLYPIRCSSACQQLFYFSSLPSQATAILDYHRQSSLSTTFSYFQKFFQDQLSHPMPPVSLLFFFLCRRISDSLLIIALHTAEVNTFWPLFLK
ncbi:hypothetical protein, partial [Eubacterium ramulus]